MTTHIRTLIFVVGVSLGVTVGHYSLVGSEIALASLLLFILLVTARSINKKFFSLHEIKSSLVTTTLLLLSFSFCIGIVRMQFVEPKVRFVCEENCLMKGRVVASPEVRDTYQVFDLAINGNENNLYVRVRTPLYPRYQVGDTITLFGKPVAPNTIFPHENKKSFDYDMYLRLHNVGSEMYYPKVAELKSDEDKSVNERLILFKKLLVEKIDLLVSSPASGLASGMLLGNGEMSKELTNTFRVAGLSHIVVLSGFNIAIMIATLLFIFRFLPLFMRGGLTVFFVVLFVIMVGGEASVVRATLMAFISLLALLTGRDYIGRQALLVSLLCIIFYSPLSLLYDVSLHLSFLATAGIIYMHEGMKKITNRFSHGGYQDIVTTTLSAYLATLPYSMYTFGTASIYAVFTNFIVLPFVPVIMLLTFTTLVVSFISMPISYVFGYVVSLLSGCILFVARFVDGLPYASITFTLSCMGMVFLYLCIVITYMYVHKKSKDETRVTKDGEMISPVLSY